VDHRSTLYIGRQGEALVLGHVLAPIPGERLVELSREFLGLLDQGIDDGLGILAVDLGQQQVARMALEERGDLAVVAAEQQVAFPVPRHGALFNAGRALTDRDRVGDPTVIGPLGV
jgi:hypothetical protein